MIETNHLINVQRLLLLTRGFTENTLQVEGQPRRFLSTLDHQLRQLERQFPKSAAPQVFAHRMGTAFENGRFPVALDFTYKYFVGRQDLTLISLKASLFDIEITYPMEGKRNADLPTAAQVLKELKKSLHVNLQKEVARDGQKHPPRSWRHRVG